MVCKCNYINMKKLNYFKTGSIACMLLGVMHLFVSLSPKDGVGENVLLTYANMKETIFDFMGQHDLMQFYMGFSITMGFMLFAFGLQAFVNNKPTKPIIIVNMMVSLVASVLAIIYFHPLAYTFLLFSTLCYVISFIKIIKAS